ncbi:hypothetical protein [Melittangium boletus]|uniref:hypothetical protein n=1 Tax=Melittangium boletus TaxID=83453 RepID=UPI003DA3CF65
MAYASAWKRDQILPVQIRTDEPHLDSSQLRVSLKGSDGSATTPVEVVPFTTGCDARFCGTARLKLWEPTFNTFRGSMPIVVQGRDTVGNEGSSNPAEPKVAVTRWKWVFDAQGTIRTTPAIGQSGFVYLGMSTGPNGRVFGLKADGRKSWEMSLGAVEGGISVGANNAGSELVYVGARTSSGASLYALRGNDGSTLKKCPETGGGVFGTGTLIGGIGVGALGASPIETAVTIYNGTDSSAGDPSNIVSVDSSGACYSSGVTSGDAIGSVVQDGPVAIRGKDLFYPSSGDTGAKLASYVYGAATPSANWPVGLSYIPRSLALVGTNVFASTASTDSIRGGVLRIPQSGGEANVTPVYPAGTALDARVYGLAVGGTDELFFGTQAVSSLTFTRVPPEGLSKSETSTVNVRASPVVGTRAVYSASTGGVVDARAKDSLSLIWQLAPGVGTVNSSPTLDCSRDASGAAIPGAPGVLYVPAGGKLHAFVVDGAGLDSSARWPKYQHDARNTGNPDTVIPPCP